MFHILIITVLSILLVLSLTGHIAWLVTTGDNECTIIERRKYVMQHNDSHPSFMCRLWFMFLFEIATIWDESRFDKSDLLQIHDLYVRMTFLGKLLFVCNLFSIINDRDYGLRSNISINGYWFIIKPIIMLPVIALYFARMVTRLIYHSIDGNSDGSTKSVFIKPEPTTEDKKSLHDIYDKS